MVIDRSNASAIHASLHRLRGYTGGPAVMRGPLGSDPLNCMPLAGGSKSAFRICQLSMQNERMGIVLILNELDSFDQNQSATRYFLRKVLGDMPSCRRNMREK